MGDCVDEFVHENGVEIPAERPGWTVHGLRKLVTCQTGRQVQRTVDRFRQIQKAHAVAEKIRAHCEHDEYPRLACIACMEQQVDEGISLVSLSRSRLGVRKDFLKLIDEQEEVAVLVIGVLLGVSDEADESKRAPPQFSFDGLLRKV